LVSQVLGEITDTLAAGENVKLSSFGIFNVRDKRNQVGRNPKTGVAVPIEPRQIVVFIASRILKAHVNGAAKKSVRRRRVKRVSVLEA
jgi:integration host factor subunit alpha